MASLQICSISFHFVLREMLYETKYCSSLKLKIFGTSKNFGLATSLALLSSLSDDSDCNFFIRSRLHVSVTLDILHIHSINDKNAYG